MVHYKSIIISGRPASGKSALADSISKEYGLKEFSIGKLWRKTWAERYPNGEMPFEEYWRNTGLEENIEMDKKAGIVINEGGVVADLRFSSITSDPGVLKVFVDANLEIRVRRVMKTDRYGGLSDKDIHRVLIEREEDEVNMGKLIYGKDYDYRDLMNYHVVLNSGMLDIGDEVKIIGKFIRK